MHYNDANHLASENPLHLLQLARTASSSSVSTNATAPNLEGAGRTLGLLYDNLGARLKGFLNERGKRGVQDDNTHDVVSNQRHSGSRLSRTDTPSSVSTNATQPNLEGAGRTVGLVFDKLGSHMGAFLNGWATRRGHGPKAVAQEIRRLLRHDEVTITQRHAGYEYHFTRKEEKALRKKCKRLLKFARISTNQFQALEEVICLAIENPRARQMLAQCDVQHYLTPKYEEMDLKLVLYRAAGSLGHEKVHNLWSDLLLGRFSWYQGSRWLSHSTDSGIDEVGIRLLHGQSARRFLRSFQSDELYSRLRQLRHSLSDPRSSFLAARYLKEFGFRHCPTTLSDEPNSRYQDITKWLCKCYITDASRFPFEFIEWSNLAELFSFGDISRDAEFLLEKRELAPCLVTLIREVPHVPDLLLTNFPATSLLLHDGPLTPHVSFATTCLEFLDNLTGSATNNRFSEHVSYIRNLDNRTRKLLKGTVFANEAFVAYCHLLVDADNTFLHTLLLSKNLYFLDLHDWEKGSLIHPESQLAALLDFRQDGDDDIIAKLMAQYTRINRYCKNTMVRMLGKLQSTATILKDISSWAETNSAHSARVFEDEDKNWGGVRLVRFRLDGKLYRTPLNDFGGFLCHENARPVEYEFARTFGREIGNNKDIYDRLDSVTRWEADTMDIPKNAVMTIRVGGGEAFDATGHYAVLAGYDGTGEPLYIAMSGGSLNHSLQSSSATFTCIKDGASHAAFRRQDGVTETREEFYVLVLRHDPIDWDPSDGILGRPEDAMDPTGPVFWNNYPNFVEGIRGIHSRRRQDVINKKKEFGGSSSKDDRHKPQLASTTMNIQESECADDQSGASEVAGSTVLRSRVQQGTTAGSPELTGRCGGGEIALTESGEQYASAVKGRTTSESTRV